MEKLKEYARTMLKTTGHEEISLSSLSSSDYSDLKELVTFLIDEFKDKGINISLPVPANRRLFSGCHEPRPGYQEKQPYLCPGSRSQRMRDVINKGLTEEDILEGAARAFEGGWNKVKLYFMLGTSYGDGGGYEGDRPSVRSGGAQVITRSRKSRGTGNARSRQAPLSLCPRAFYSLPVGVHVIC